ncbi:MAG: hypothetical protein Q9M39_08785, partial [Sulfurovum sp.]|nr:hypothetical protein [Sulfurovum sp.]
MKALVPSLIFALSSTFVYANPCPKFAIIPYDSLVIPIPIYDKTITEPDLDCDEIIDTEDDDIDGDGIPNANDAFPRDAEESIDTDNDGIGNNADTDDDNDGYSDAQEIAAGSDPLDPNSVPSQNQTPTAVIATVDLNLTIAELENIGVKLDASQSTDSDGRIIKYEWFVDGNLISQMSNSTNYLLATYMRGSEAAATEHNLSLKVTDNKGATDTKILHFRIQAPSVGFLVKPNLNWSYELNHIEIDTNTIPESNVTLTVTASKENMFNGSTTTSLVFTEENHKNITLYYSMPKNASENYLIHFDLSHSDDLNYEGIQLADINLTYDPEILRVNPPNGSKEFISGEKGTLEFIAYIDVNLVGIITNEQNVFYQGLESNLNYKLIDAPQGMVFNGDRLTWTPTQAQSNQSYTVMVRVSDGLVEETVTFDVYVAEDKYLNTEVQDGKLVVVDPTSKLDGLTVEPLDGSDPGLMKIKIAPEAQVPRKDLDATYKIRLADVFMIENRPKEYVIGLNNMESFMQQFGATKMALRYYLKHGEYSDGNSGGWSWEISEIVNRKIEKFREHKESINRPFFYFFTVPKYLPTLGTSNSANKQAMRLRKKMPMIQKSNSALCQPQEVVADWDNQPNTYEFYCSLNTNTIVRIVDKKALTTNHTMWGDITPDTLVQWIRDAQNNVSQLGMDAHNMHEGNLTIKIEKNSVGGGRTFEVNGIKNNHQLSLDRNKSEYNNVRKNIAQHEYFHLVQEQAIDPVDLKGNWKTEGTAKWFEDYNTFDNGDSYKKYTGLNPFNLNLLSAGLLGTPTDNKKGYKHFLFWKMLANKCTPTV